MAGKEILKGIDLTVRSGEVHVLMGPNGSGKSTLSHVIMGRPGYEVLGGTVTLDGVDLLGLEPWERAQAGLFLAMQYPTEVPGVAVVDVLEAAFAGLGRDTALVPDRIIAEAGRIGFDDRFLHRAMNVDLSGGEKKRNETLQLGVLEPSIAILDELDSGLDVDALRACARRIEAATEETGPRRPGHHPLQPAAARAQGRPRPRARRRDDPAQRRAGAGPRAGDHRLRRMGGGRRPRAAARATATIPSPTRSPDGAGPRCPRGRTVPSAAMLGRQARLERDASAVDQARRAPIERAIERREVLVVFQPVVRLADGATVGYEALARLGEHSDPPAPWFRVGPRARPRHGARARLRRGHRRRSASRPATRCCSSTSARPRSLHPRMQELCAPLADRLVVELTEHIEVVDYTALRPSIERWSARGVRLAVDDTGAGYASLRHVLELAPHFLKLDRTVVGGVDQHAARRALVAALVTFADEVHTTVIAEGVERWSEAQALRDIGVHLAQGFAFGRPAMRCQPGEWPRRDDAAPAAPRRSGRLRAVPEPGSGVSKGHARRH